MMSARHLPFRGTGTASRTPPQAPLASQSRLHRAIGHARSSALQPSQPILPAQSRIHRASRRTHSCQVSAYVTTSAPSQSTAKSQTQAQLAQQIVVNYRTGWSQAVLHGSLCGAEWSDYPLVAVPSAPNKWKRARFQFPAVTPGSDKMLLEFVLTNKKNDWDKPVDGTNYTITAPGNYEVSHGSIKKVTGKRVMVVSDLDGTMVGDDAATLHFKQWWEETAIPRGDVLVYNTGRSLESFNELLKSKQHCLARPDALITAVGTKIYEYDGEEWLEDEQWLDQLDYGWHLEDAREACYRALSEVTCGVQAAILKEVLEVVEGNLAVKGVKANVITSGHGQWRYMDIVPTRAGKLSALNHVRRLYGFKQEETVACGDSGNDILMLQGDNPAIVVGNAQSDLKDWYLARHESEPRGNGPNGKQRLLMTRKHEALGILEGLDHWGFK